MSKINKFNEFINNDELLIKHLIEDAEHTNKSDLISIANRESYKKVISMGEMIIPYLLERLDHSGLIWDIALSKLTGVEHDLYKVDELNFYHLSPIDVSDFWKKWASENGF